MSQCCSPAIGSPTANGGGIRAQVTVDTRGRLSVRSRPGGISDDLPKHAQLADAVRGVVLDAELVCSALTVDAGAAARDREKLPQHPDRENSPPLTSMSR